MTTPGASTPRRKAEISPLRRLSRNVLIIGTVVAVVAAFGPVWVVRAGVLVAVAAAVLACVTAWRELAEARHRHAEEMLAASKASGAVLSRERRNNASVVDTLTARVQHAADDARQAHATVADLTMTITTLQTQIGTQRIQLSALQEEGTAAREEIRQRESVIAELRETVRAREAELVALSQASGQVRAIPRRVLAEHQIDSAQLPEADELWPDSAHPEVADLVDVSVVLPNYEGERKLA